VSTPKRHHYLPQFFLLGFGEGSQLAVYDRVKDQCRIQSARDTAVISNYYTFDWEDGTRDTEFERLHGTFEGKAKPVIDCLERGEKLTSRQRVDLGYFLAFLVTRVPRHEKAGEDIVNLTAKNLAKGFFPTPEAVQQYSETTPKPMSMEEATFFHRFVHEELYTVKRSRSQTLVESMERAREAAPHIIFMDWVVAHTTDACPFVLTDAPLGFILNEKDKGSGEPILGLLSDRVTNVIPLTKTTCLLMVRKKSQARLVHYSVDPQQVRQINTAVIHESERFVIAKDKTVVMEAIAKASPLPAKGSKMRLDEIPHPTDPTRSLLVMHRTQPGFDDVPLKMDFAKMWAAIDAEKAKS
jgi:hypothetical protein